jgi:RimJ/RimL family protein N-acetyltransferase
MDLAFDRLRARRVISTVSQGNAASIRLMKRFEMRHDFARDYGPTGDWRTLVYSLEWNEWNAASALEGRRRA